MPSFQGISALVGKTLSIAEPGLNLQYLESKQATRFNLVKKSGCFATYVRAEFENGGPKWPKGEYTLLIVLVGCSALAQLPLQPIACMTTGELIVLPQTS